MRTKKSGTPNEGPVSIGKCRLPELPPRTRRGRRRRLGCRRRRRMMVMRSRFRTRRRRRRRLGCRRRRRMMRIHRRSGLRARLRRGMMRRGFRRRPRLVRSGARHLSGSIRSTLRRGLARRRRAERADSRKRCDQHQTLLHSENSFSVVFIYHRPPARMTNGRYDHPRQSGASCGT